MTQRRRDRERGLLPVLEARPPVGVGRGLHRLDGGYGRAKTIFDSELYRFLSAVIDYARGHSEVPFSAAEDTDLELICQQAGLSTAQWEVVAMRVEGFSTREVAGFLDISQPAVMDRLRRARAVLAKAKEADALSLLRRTNNRPSQEALGEQP